MQRMLNINHKSAPKGLAFGGPLFGKRSHFRSWNRHVHIRSSVRTGRVVPRQVFKSGVNQNWSTDQWFIRNDLHPQMIIPNDCQSFWGIKNHQKDFQTPRRARNKFSKVTTQAISVADQKCHRLCLDKSVWNSNCSCRVHYFWWWNLLFLLIGLMILMGKSPMLDRYIPVFVLNSSLILICCRFTSHYKHPLYSKTLHVFTASMSLLLKDIYIPRVLKFHINNWDWTLDIQAL